MTSPKERLNNVFNACAGKIVFVYELHELMMTSLASRLTTRELKDFNDNALAGFGSDINKLTGDKQFLDALVQAVGDGTIGIYAASIDGSPPLPFFHVKYLELLTSFPEGTPYVDSVIEAFADAVEQSVDSKDEIKVGLKRGIVKGMQPSQIPGR